MELVGKIFMSGRFFLWSNKFVKPVTAQSSILLSLLSKLFIDFLLLLLLYIFLLLVVSFIAALGFLLYGGR